MSESRKAFAACCHQAGAQLAAEIGLGTYFEQAVYSERAGNMREAVVLYAKAARSGDGKAAHRLGEIYEKGLGGVQRNPDLASRWYNNARALGHPTLIPMSFRHHQPEELWSEDREERAVAALYHAGVAFEISSRYPPHERIVRRAVERGVRISLGSDGHTAQQVANVSAPLALARALGVTDTDLYDPIQHGSKTHAGDHARM